MGSEIELINGDCLEEMKKIPDGSIDLVLTDPPYGTTACKWDTVIPFEPMWEQLKRVTKKNGVINFVIPCDPGFLLRIFRRMVSIPNARKFGVSQETYEKINAYEHVSSFQRTLTIIRGEIEFDRELKVRYFPFPFIKSWNLNAFAIVSIQGKKF
jgi:tRNA G10  N-methylase Trm11